MFSSFVDFRIHRSVLRCHIKGGHFNRTWGCSSSLTPSHLLLQIFKSESFQQYISANMAAFSSSCTLCFLGPEPIRQQGLGKDRFHLFIWNARIKPSNIHFPAETRRRCDMRGCVCMFLWDRRCRWLCSLPGGGFLFLRGPSGFCLELWCTIQIWILLTPLSRAGVSNAASCVRLDSQPSLSSCWDGATPKLITLNEQKL